MSILRVLPIQNLLLLVFATLLSGCGGKGPLYLMNTEIARVYFKLGETYEFGIVTGQDYSTAARYYREAYSWSGTSEWGI